MKVSKDLTTKEKHKHEERYFIPELYQSRCPSLGVLLPPQNKLPSFLHFCGLRMLLQNPPLHEDSPIYWILITLT